MSRHDYVQAILKTLDGKVIKTVEGTEEKEWVVLDSTDTPLVGKMFKIQAGRWYAKGSRHLRVIADLVERFVEAVVKGASDNEQLADQIMALLVKPKLKDNMASAENVLQKIAEPARKGMTLTRNEHYYAISFNHFRSQSDYTGWQDLRYNDDVRKLTHHHSQLLAKLKDERSCGEAVDCMRAHCKVSWQ